MSNSAKCGGNVFELDRVVAGYGNRALCSPFSVTLRPGAFVSVLGANGAGKSTLLKTASLEIPPLSGVVKIDGVNLSLFSRRKFARIMAVVTTARIEADALTVREVVEMGRQPFTNFFGRLDADDVNVVNEAMTFTGVAAMSEHFVTSLSDGERQKVMIARALAQDTPVILLDEPTSFLDVASRLEIMALLKRLSAERGKIVVLSTHDVSSALIYSTEMWLMIKGKDIVSATPTELLDAHRKFVGETPCGDSPMCSSPLDELFADRGLWFSTERLDYIVAE